MPSLTHVVDSLSHPDFVIEHYDDGSFSYVRRQIAQPPPPPTAEAP
jgi:hypothetical protein